MKKCICPLEHACKVDMRLVDSVLACHCQIGNEGVYSSRRRVYKKKWISAESPANNYLRYACIQKHIVTQIAVTVLCNNKGKINC